MALFWLHRIKRQYRPLHDRSRNTSFDQMSSFSFPFSSFSSRKSVSKKSVASSRRSKPRSHVSEDANLRSPKTHGAFTPSVKKIHSSGRSVGWSISEEHEGEGRARGPSSGSLSLIEEELIPPNAQASSSASAIVSGSQSFLPLRAGNPDASLHPVGATPGISSPLPLAQDTLNTNMLNNTRPTRGVGGNRPPMMHVVSTHPPRGFRIDDANITVNPSSADQPGAAPHPLARTAAMGSSPPPVPAPRSNGSVFWISRRPGENFPTLPNSTNTEGRETIFTSISPEVRSSPTNLRVCFSR